MIRLIIFHTKAEAINRLGTRGLWRLSQFVITSPASKTNESRMKSSFFHDPRRGAIGMHSMDNPSFRRPFGRALH
jgi:hypothetical protein